MHFYFFNIFFFSEYNDTSEKYTFLQILYLFVCYVLLFIGVGSSALLSQKILIDNYKQFISFLEQTKDEDIQDNNFIFIV